MRRRMEGRKGEKTFFPFLAIPYLWEFSLASASFGPSRTWIMTGTCISQAASLLKVWAPTSWAPSSELLLSLEQLGSSPSTVVRAPSYGLCSSQSPASSNPTLDPLLPPTLLAVTASRSYCSPGFSACPISANICGTTPRINSLVKYLLWCLVLLPRSWLIFLDSIMLTNLLPILSSFSENWKVFAIYLHFTGARLESKKIFTSYTRVSYRMLFILL